MKPRALIFDLYKTLLEVGPPPADAAARWTELWTETFSSPPRLNLENFAAACETIIAREHARARAVGIAYPEIFWPRVTAEALPELAGQTESLRDQFLYVHAQLQRTLRLMPGANAVLPRLVAAQLPLGIASNSQPYTLHELETVLKSAGLSRTIFAPDLSFLSFAAGFSKPDPHVFRWLTARLQVRGIATAETLMVGDRLDNDIGPAQAQGFQTWQLTPGPGNGTTSGNWAQLGEYLRRQQG